VALIALAATACIGGPDSGAPDGGSAPRPAVRDSLGVTIVEHTSLDGADTLSWRIGFGDSVRIGRPGLAAGAEEYHLGRAVGAVRLRDGRVAVGDALAHTIRIYEADGAFSASVGRRGEGPGEFTRLLGLLRVNGDSVLAIDRAARWTLLDPSGRFVRTGSLDLAYWPGDTYPQIQAAFADGSLLVSHGPETPGTTFEWGVRHEKTVGFYRVHRRGSLLAEFGTFPSGTSFIGEGRAFNLPYQWVGFSPAVPPRRATWGERFYWSNEGLWEVRVFAADGGLERIIRMDRQALASSARPPFGFPAPDLDPAVERVFEEARAAVGVGPFVEFAVDEAGYLWFREQMDRDDDQDVPARWYVFDPDGTLRHVVRLPYHWRAGTLRIGADHVLALERDEYMVETYLLVPLIRN
jgi:hypothetical protein